MVAIPAPGPIIRIIRIMFIMGVPLIMFIIGIPPIMFIMGMPPIIPCSPPIPGWPVGGVGCAGAGAGVAVCGG